VLLAALRLQGLQFVQVCGRSGVVAISPPNQFPKEIWLELCKQGKLKQAGHGMYEMIGG